MQLSKFITRLTFSTAFISILFAFLISVLYQYNNFEKDKLHIKEEFTEQKKKEIKREVLSIYNVIEHKEALFEKGKMIVNAKIVSSTNHFEVNTLEQLRELDENSSDLVLNPNVNAGYNLAKRVRNIVNPDSIKSKRIYV